MKLDERYVTCDGVFKASTHDAILISQDGEEYWIPRSVLYFDVERRIGNWPRNSEQTIRLMQWFADKKGMGYENE